MSRSSVPSKRSADAQEAAWVADEDRFVLQQEKRKAVIRVKSGRAEPIDWLTVTLILIDPQNNQVGDEIEDDEFELVDPETLFRDLDKEQVKSLGRRIDTYVGLERIRSNREYWSMMKTICDDRSRSLQEGQQSARGIGSVSSDIDRILGPKSLEQLEKLETQIKAKLASDQAIDTDYWEHLLNSLLTYKARAKLGDLSQSVTSARLKALRAQQVSGAAMLRSQIEARTSVGTNHTDKQGSKSALKTRSLDPEPMLRLNQEDKSLVSMSEKEFTDQIGDDRRNVLRKGYFSYHSSHGGASASGLQEPVSKRVRTDGGDASQPSLTNYDREVARGLGENEELFTREEEVETKNRSQWADIYRPRKPKYFNRVHLGYEWNKYNQTHYDHDNPPPKVVQGYRFNIFYPDLVDKTKAPTYRIERENGRRRGQTLAPAGEDDTCLIRFTAGPPYEDIAFRIVDKEWDYSAKRDRGFRSSFDKGVLQLYFQLKKIYYRK